MADKIDQLKIGDTSYDIDLPPDATPSISTLTASGSIKTVSVALPNAGSVELRPDTTNQTDPTVRIIHEGQDYAGTAAYIHTNKLEYEVSTTDGSTTYTYNFPMKNGTIAVTSDGVIEISTSSIRITDLSTGVYKLTFNGTKSIYYSGTSGTSKHTVSSSSGAVILVVNRYGPSYWSWYYINGTSSYTTVTLYYGFTNTVSGNYSSKVINDLKTTDANYYPTRLYTSGLQISNYVGSTNCAIYVPYATDSQYGVIKTSDLPIIADLTTI